MDTNRTKEMINRLESASFDGVPAEEVMKLVLENQLSLIESDYWLVTVGTYIKSTTTTIYNTEPINKKPIDFIRECNEKYGVNEKYWLVFAIPISMTKEEYEEYSGVMG